MAHFLTGIKEYFLGTKNQYVATVAIDLGTVSSGFAYTLHTNQSQDAIFVNSDWVNEFGHRTSRTPTCLLLKPDLSFYAFGYKALEWNAYFQSTHETQDMLFFEVFKRDLHSDKIVDFDCTLKAANGKSIRAITVFAQCIKFFKDEAVACVRREVGEDEIDDEKIYWVFTVPQSWTGRSKQFMREAAYEAGIGSRGNLGQLMIVSEAEAALEFCVKTELSTPVLIADIGGGGLEMTLFEQHDEGKVVKTDKVTRPANTAVHEEMFLELLERTFGEQKIQDYQKLYPSDLHQIFQNFEAKKRTFRFKETKIQLPGSFVSFVNDFLSPSMKHYSKGEVRIVDDQYLCLCAECMKTLLKSVAEDAITEMKAFLGKPQLSEGVRIFLLGGHAESLHLQEEFKREFSGRHDVTTYRDASLAIVKGTMMVAKAMSSNRESGIIGACYGVDCSRNFVRGLHPPEKKFFADGKAKCRDLFHCIVKKNDTIRHGEKISVRYRPLYANETEIKYTFYASQRSDVDFIFVTDQDVKEIGSIVIHSPDTRNGSERDIIVSIYFGGTDLIASAWDVTSGKRAQTTLEVSPPF